MSSRAQKAAQIRPAARRTLHQAATRAMAAGAVNGALAARERASRLTLGTVVCCEREALGVEGVGHGPDCPATHSDRQGGDAA